MGVSTDALLVYGFPVDEDDVPDVEDPWEEMEGKILKVCGGLDQTWNEAYTIDNSEGWFDREAKAKEIAGVEIVGHCSDEVTMYLVASIKHRAWRGETVRITDFTPGDDVKLRAAAEVLGIDKPEIGWWLASWWG